MLPEVAAIHSAVNRREASRIRNAVAFDAMKRRRREADADACRDAFYERWGTN